jgi:hypothetical protein
VAVELATLQWGDWFNNRRLLQRIGKILRAESRNANTPCRNKPCGVTRTK